MCCQLLIGYGSFIFCLFKPISVPVWSKNTETAQFRLHRSTSVVKYKQIQNSVLKMCFCNIENCFLYKKAKIGAMN
jgi:hypothetical protein